MKSKWWQTGVLIALVGAGWLMMEPNAAEAQRRGGGGSWGGSRGGSGVRVNIGLGNGYYGNGYGSGYGSGYGYGNGYGSGYGSGYGYGNGYYSGYRSGYGGYYSSNYPGYSLSYSSPSYFYSSPSYYSDNSYQSNYPPQEQVNEQQLGRVMLRLPMANAEVWINGVKTTQQGTSRQFETRPLESGYTYSYEVKARWMDNNGQQMEQTRTARFQPGQQVTVDFTQQQPRENIPDPRKNPTPRDDNSSPLDR